MRSPSSGVSRSCTRANSSPVTDSHQSFGGESTDSPPFSCSSMNSRNQEPGSRHSPHDGTGNNLSPAFANSPTGQQTGQPTDLICIISHHSSLYHTGTEQHYHLRRKMRSSCPWGKSRCTQQPEKQYAEYSSEYPASAAALYPKQFIYQKAQSLNSAAATPDAGKHR